MYVKQKQDMGGCLMHDVGYGSNCGLQTINETNQLHCHTNNSNDGGFADSLHQV